MAVDVRDLESGIAHPDSPNSLWVLLAQQSFSHGFAHKENAVATGTANTTETTVSRFPLIADALSGMVLSAADAAKLRRILSEQKLPPTAPSNVTHVDDVPEIYAPGTAPE